MTFQSSFEVVEADDFVFVIRVKQWVLRPDTPFLSRDAGGPSVRRDSIR